MTRAGPACVPADRAAFRAFVRAHHPDVGGDPATFRTGLDAFRAAARAPDVLGPDRFDGPIVIVHDPSPLARALRAVTRRVTRHRRPPRVR